MEFQPLTYIYQPSGNKDARTLLLLHGTGGDENDLIPLAAHFGKDMNVLSLRGNVSEGGMPRFFKRLGMGIFDEQDLSFRTHELIAFVKELAVKENFDPSRIIALGYSNGANIIGSILMLYPELLQGAVMYRPMQPFKTPESFSNKSHTPVFASNGIGDPTIRIDDTAHYMELLKAAGYDLTAFSFNTGHNLSHEDLNKSAEWYHKYFK
jgi:phospholipase/carboxylesterase